MGIGYMLSPGRQIVVNYSYNSIFSRYIANALSLGGNSSHMLSLNFVDSIKLGFARGQNTNNQFAFNPDSGIIKGCVFLDLNQNGIKDTEEAGIPDIDVTVKNMYTVSADKKGNYVASNLSDNVYVIGIEKNTLPVIYTPVGNDVAVNVKRKPPIHKIS